MVAGVASSSSSTLPSSPLSPGGGGGGCSVTYSSAILPSGPSLPVEEDRSGRPDPMATTERTAGPPRSGSDSGEDHGGHQQRWQPFSYASATPPPPRHDLSSPLPSPTSGSGVGGGGVGGQDFFFIR